MDSSKNAEVPQNSKKSKFNDQQDPKQSAEEPRPQNPEEEGDLRQKPNPVSGPSQPQSDASSDPESEPSNPGVDKLDHQQDAATAPSQPQSSEEPRPQNPEEEGDLSQKASVSGPSQPQSSEEPRWENLTEEGNRDFVIYSRGQKPKPVSGPSQPQSYASNDSEAGPSNQQQEAASGPAQAQVPAAVVNPSSTPRPEYVRLMMAEIKMFLNSQECHQREADRPKWRCHMPQCRAMKNLVIHMQACPHGLECPMKPGHCRNMRNLIGHFTNCTRSDCEICQEHKDERLRRISAAVAYYCTDGVSPSAFNYPPGLQVPKADDTIDPTKPVVDPELRERCKFKIYKAWVPDYDPEDDEHDPMRRHPHLFRYAERAELQIFKMTESRSEYIHIASSKIAKIRIDSATMRRERRAQRLRERERRMRSRPAPGG